MIQISNMNVKKTRNDIQSEALKVAISNNRCTLTIGMGVGKTYIGLKYIEYMQYLNKKKFKVLIAAPKKSIIQSWKDEADKFNMNDVLSNTTFTTYLSLVKQDTDYDILILDECHNLLSSHLPYLSLINSKILGLTGTPPRHSGSEKGEIIRIFCPVMYEYITKDAVNDNILNDYRIIVHYMSLNQNKDLQVNYKNGSFMTSEIANYMYWTNRIEEAANKKSKQIASVMRMKAMMEYNTKEVYAYKLFKAEEDKCIIFCNTQAQADRMCKNSYHSNNPNSEENLINFKNNKINKLSCVLQLSEGVNIPKLKTGVILHAYGNERKSSQRIARMLRLNPDDVSTIHILCYRNTVDEFWVKSALQDFDQTKIEHIIN
jgi:superfamily II DNA or RNA helicase